MTQVPRERGFTLLEFLVALSIASLLAVLVYGAVRLGVRSWEVGEDRVTTHSSKRVGWWFIKQSLDQAMPWADKSTPQNDQLFFGDRRSINYVAELPGHLGQGGLYVISLFSEIEGQTERLVLMRTPVYTWEENPTAELYTRVELVASLADFRVDYYGDPRKGGTSEWRPRWKGHATLPTLVRINVKPTGQAPWPMLYAYPERRQARYYKHEPTVRSDIPILQLSGLRP